MEGKTFWQIQTLPVKSGKVYLSKIMANLTVAAPFYVISVVFACLTVEPDLATYFWIAVNAPCRSQYQPLLLKFHQGKPDRAWAPQFNEIINEKYGSALHFSDFLKDKCLYSKHLYSIYLTNILTFC